MQLGEADFAPDSKGASSNQDPGVGSGELCVIRGAGLLWKEFLSISQGEMEECSRSD